VMYAGRIVETGPAAAVLHDPRHPYTQGLIRSIPRIDAGRHEAITAIRGAMPDMRNLPPGCSFHPRCDRFQPGLCDQASAAADFHDARPGHRVRCERLDAEARS
jgi:oligopeptide/dipeptide ABC transporter ATP-binding protein